jgi:hypothetical protein
VGCKHEGAMIDSVYGDFQQAVEERNWNVSSAMFRIRVAIFVALHR